MKFHVVLIYCFNIAAGYAAAGIISMLCINATLRGDAWLAAFNALSCAFFGGIAHSSLRHFARIALDSQPPAPHETKQNP